MYGEELPLSCLFITCNKVRPCSFFFFSAPIMPKSIRSGTIEGKKRQEIYFSPFFWVKDRRAEPTFTSLQKGLLERLLYTLSWNICFKLVIARCHQKTTNFLRWSSYFPPARVCLLYQGMQKKKLPVPSAPGAVCHPSGLRTPMPTTLSYGVSGIQLLTLGTVSKGQQHLRL